MAVKSSPGSRKARLPMAGTRTWRAPTAFPSARPSNEVLAAPYAQSCRIPLRLRSAGNLEGPRNRSLHLWLLRQRSRRQVRARGIDFRPLRREFQLARPNLDARELSDHRITSKILQILRQRFQSRVPVRLGEVLNDPRSCQRTRPSVDADFS